MGRIQRLRYPVLAIAKMRSSSRLAQDSLVAVILCSGNNTRVCSSLILRFSQYISAFPEVVDIQISARWTDPSIADAARMAALLNPGGGDKVVASTHGDHAR